MKPCVPHPGDATRWVPVEDIIAELWSQAKAASALIDLQAQTLVDHDRDLTAHQDRADALQASLAAVGERVAMLEGLPARIDSLADEVAALRAQVAALTPKTGSAYGVDVSGHQTLAQVQAAAQDPANDFVIVKATEGMGGKNDAYAAQRAAAGGKFLGAYHFAWSNQDPIKEAANFVATAALKRGELAFLDVENWGTGSHPTPEMQATSWAARLTFALAWLDEVKAKTGATPVLYANWDWIKNLRTAATVAQWARLTDYPLWLADYSGTGGKHSTVTSKDGSNPDSWPIVLHQYAVDTLDRNYTPNLGRLRALAVPA